MEVLNSLPWSRSMALAVLVAEEFIFAAVPDECSILFTDLRPNNVSADAYLLRTLNGV